MKAIILAAGRGSRLGSKADGRPKALLKIGGRTMIEHQLEALSSEGVGPVTVVIGHEGDQIRAALGESVEYVVNERYEETNSLYSLWLAREVLSDEVLLLNSDLFFHPRILKRLLAVPGSALAYDSVSATGAEQTKVGLRKGRITDLGKDLPVTGSRGENLGLIKLDGPGAAALRRRAEAIIATGDEKIWVTEAVRSILVDVEVRGVNVAGLPWTEVDFPYDLDQARRVIWPQIERSTRRRHSVLRSLRWPALASAPVLAGLLAWNYSAEVGPASIDWETVSPLESTSVRLQKGTGGSQKWWTVQQGEALTVQLEDGGPLRVEARPVLAPEHQPAVFVVVIAVDGEPIHYEAGRSALDPKITLANHLVGQREREDLMLSPGRHTVTVRFPEGTAPAVLVRVRKPE